jgi:hypothetical protein
VGAFDRYLEAIAKDSFRKYELSLEFTYLTSLDVPTLLERLKHLPSWWLCDQLGRHWAQCCRHCIKGSQREKSRRSFAPNVVSMMFPCFKSRCTTPVWCALSSAICAPYFSTCSSASGPFSSRFASVSPSIHHQIVHAIPISHVIQNANVRMIQA